MSFIYECLFCSERCQGKYCKDHGSQSNRKTEIEKQLKIEKERGSKTEMLFGHKRKLVLEKYNIKDW